MHMAYTGSLNRIHAHRERLILARDYAGRLKGVGETRRYAIQGPSGRFMVRVQSKKLYRSTLPQKRLIEVI
jgi:hypothetical protein